MVKKYNRNRIFTVGLQEIDVVDQKYAGTTFKDVRRPTFLTKGEKFYRKTIYGVEVDQADIRSIERNPLKIEHATNYLETKDEFFNQRGQNSRMIMELEIRMKALQNMIENTNDSNPDYFQMIQDKARIEDSLKSLKYAQTLLENGSIQNEPESKPKPYQPPVGGYVKAKPEAAKMNEETFDSAVYQRVLDDGSVNNPVDTFANQTEDIDKNLKPLPGSQCFTIMFWIVFLAGILSGVFFMIY